MFSWSIKRGLSGSHSGDETEGRVGLNQMNS